MLAQAAAELGLSFWDTAPPYGSHPHVREGLRLVRRGDVQVASKSRAEAAETARAELAGLAQDLGTDYLDLGFIHYVKPGTWEQRIAALPGFVQARSDGVIRAVGLSTHSPEIVRLAAGVPDIDVVCATYNPRGLWFDSGTPAEMVAALRAARSAGKGIYLIKLLGHGQIGPDPAAIEQALAEAFRLPEADVFNIGLANLEQARADLALLQRVRI